MQKKKECNLRQEATNKNNERTTEEAENWQLRVVERRGERRILYVQKKEKEKGIGAGSSKGSKTMQKQGRHPKGIRKNNLPGTKKTVNKSHQKKPFLVLYGNCEQN